MDDGGFVLRLSSSRETEHPVPMFWAVEALFLLDSIDIMDRGLAINYIVRCQREDGSMFGNPYLKGIPSVYEV